MSDDHLSDFQRATSTEHHGSLLADLWDFLRSNKKWWLLPILTILVLFGLLMLLSGTAAAPFIYTLF
jgi:hypothetical protein